MLIRTVDDVFRFMFDWVGAQDSPQPGGGRPIADLLAALPSAIATADAKLSPFAHSPGLSLMDLQDRIHAPDAQAPDAAGVRIFVTENQGVWHLGYKPQAPETLWVHGDWADGRAGDFGYTWRAVPERPEDGLIYVLLTAFTFMIGDEAVELSDDYENLPEGFTRPLWNFPATRGFLGFWLDETGKRLHFGGMGLTLTRPVGMQ